MTGGKIKKFQIDETYLEQQANVFYNDHDLVLDQVSCARMRCDGQRTFK